MLIRLPADGDMGYDMCVDPEQQPPTHNEVSDSDIDTVVQFGHADVVNIHVPERAEQRGPLGRPVREHSPLDLEVHRAINSPGELLTTYIPRPHDEQLRLVMTDALHGRSGILVLVGGSSTGKTRACWEAVQLLPDSWRLWHPISPGRPDAVIEDLDRIQPRTVVWLNETHHYLLTHNSDLGERVAARLRELLRDPSRAPVVVLGTLWPEYWQRLTTHLPVLARAEDPHAQARDLLANAGVEVAEAFTTSDITAAKNSDDRRLVDAVANARDMQVVQYLAGAPALLERYRTAPPGAAALITAAMDARRVGHGLLLSSGLLERAAPGYLTDAQWNRLGDDWFRQALDDCLLLCRGGSSPIVRMRPRPERPARDTYRLEDYLEQTANLRRRVKAVPASLWDALLDNAPAEDLPNIGAAAQARGLYRIAFLFYRAANLPRLIGQLLDICDRHEEALEWYERAVADGDPVALRRAGAASQAAGNVDEAVAFFRRAADDGDVTAVRLLAQCLLTAGRTTDALAWLESCAAAGIGVSSALLRQLRLRLGLERPRVPVPEFHADLDLEFRSEPEPESDRVLDFDVPSPPEKSPHDVDMAELEREAEGRGPDAWIHVARRCVSDGRPELALGWLRRKLRGFDVPAEQLYGDLLASCGREAEAETWYLRAADAGSESALLAAARMLERVHGTVHATAWLEQHNGPSDVWAEEIETRPVLQRNVQVPPSLPPSPREVLTGLMKTADEDHVDAVIRAAQLAVSTGRADDVIRWLQGHAETSNTIAITALRRVGLLLDEVGRHAEAVDWYLRFVETGNTGPMTRVARLLRTLGRTGEAERLLRYGIEPGGAVAGEWVAVERP